MMPVYYFFVLIFFFGFFILLSEEAKRRLESAGYEQISERDDWELKVGKKYFFTRNYSTIVAFAIGRKYDFFFFS